MRAFLSFIKKVIGLFDLFPAEARVDYLSGGEALPPPLEPDEEARAIALMGEGDADARKTLIERNLRLVVYIAKRFENSGVELEDLVSVGTIGLIKAVNTFDKGKNIKLATYASRCIENEILMFLRKMVRTKAEISLEEPLNVDWDGNVLMLADVLGTDSDVVYREVESGVERDMLQKTFATLPERDKKIVALRYGLFGEEERTQKEIAELLGISQSYISRLEKKIIGRIKKEIGQPN